MSENPVLAALEAYRRTHPHRSDDIDAAFDRYDPDSEAAHTVMPAADTAASEQLAIDEEGFDYLGPDPNDPDGERWGAYAPDA